MVNQKFKRNYDRTRSLLTNPKGAKPKPVLNTLYSVFPIEFERRNIQALVRKKFKSLNKRITIFDINIARLFARSSATKVAVCCMPKSGSTFVVSSLRRLQAYSFRLSYLHTPYMNPDFVGALSCEHEIDELALLQLELSRSNWLAQMHTKWTPYTERMFSSHNIKPIVIFRNIFDCIVSMDDMIMAKQVSGFSMIRIPKHYGSMDKGDRLSFLCLHVGPWYVDFVVSWSRTSSPTMIMRFEEDIKGFDETVAQQIRDFLQLKSVSLAEVMEAFELSDEEREEDGLLNQGICGRGDAIPNEAKEQIRKLAEVYADEVNFAGLL
jgi:Sulfotransferase domain